MSEASKAAALAHAALVHHSSCDAAATLATAQAFHDFISGLGEDKALPATKTPTKAPAKAANAAKPKKAPEPEPEGDDDAPTDEGGEVTKEEVAASVQELLNANMRDAAMKLFAKYKAKSLSGVPPEKYAEFKAAAEDLLMNS